MEKENRDKTVERPQNKNLKRDAGPGRPAGRKSFATIYREAIEKIAATQNITGDEFEVKFVEQAVRKGFNGDARFYTDTMDRLHGKAPQHIDHTTGGDKIPPMLVRIIGKDESNGDTV